MSRLFRARWPGVVSVGMCQTLRDLDLGERQLSVAVSRVLRHLRRSAKLHDLPPLTYQLLLLAGRWACGRGKGFCGCCASSGGSESRRDFSVVDLAEFPASMPFASVTSRPLLQRACLACALDTWHVQTRPQSTVPKNSLRFVVHDFWATPCCVHGLEPFVRSWLHFLCRFVLLPFALRARPPASIPTRISTCSVPSLLVFRAAAIQRQKKKKNTHQTNHTEGARRPLSRA